MRKLARRNLNSFASRKDVRTTTLPAGQLRAKAMRTNLELRRSMLLTVRVNKVNVRSCRTFRRRYADVLACAGLARFVSILRTREPLQPLRNVPADLTGGAQHSAQGGKRHPPQRGSGSSSGRAAKEASGCDRVKKKTVRTCSAIVGGLDHAAFRHRSAVPRVGRS
jgi:hypothetical protein